MALAPIRPFFFAADAALRTSDPAAKCAAVAALDASAIDAALETADRPTPLDVPGRPEKPNLVSPLKVERRSMHTPIGRAALIHALAHIEFNAINLALDAICRFAHLPADYYRDWLRVAREEAAHFQLLETHLASLGFRYGDFDAHDGLWEMAQKTAHDVLTRMALVPRVLEARGIDAAPAIVAKLTAAGDTRAVAILTIIERDEIEHVRIGNRWYRHFCAARGLDPHTTFAQLLQEYNAPRVQPPFAETARLAAGFDREDLEILQRFAAAKRRRD